MALTRSKFFNAAIVFGGSLIVFLSLAIAFARPLKPAPKAQDPREVCYDGTVYLQFESGAVFAKINRNGHLAGCP